MVMAEKHNLRVYGETVLVRDDLPELGTNLVAALASLDVNDLAHGGCGVWFPVPQEGMR
jgi:hypothetical protein